MTAKIDAGWVRRYLYYEALALYELYYSPLSTSIKQEKEKDYYPLTWVPLVFHATTFENFEKIVSDGILDPDISGKGYISFTELPIGEIDRLQQKKVNSKPVEIAIAFPRRVIQKKYGFVNPMYFEHYKDLLEKYPELQKIEKFIERNDDLGAFAEIRTDKPVSITDACWLLTNRRDEHKNLIIPGINEFQLKYGLISMSFWHRSHQTEILGEWQFLKIDKENGKIKHFESIGEFYYKMEYYNKESFKIRVPKGKHPDIQF